MLVSDIFNIGVVLTLAFESFIIEERVESLVYDAGNFLSAVGGNLGLFLGLKIAKRFCQNCFFKLGRSRLLFLHFQALLY